MNKIYLLQISFDSWKYNHRVYLDLELAKEVGKNGWKMNLEKNMKIYLKKT